MNRFAPALATLALLAGCSQSEHAATAVQSAAQAQATPTLSTTDATFINTAAQSGITEVTFGQLAREKAGRSSVRDFARRMVDEHTTVNQELTQLAASKQITPTTTVDATHQAEYDRIKGLHGRAFDRAYMNDQATDHAATVQAFQTEVANGTDPDVKAFAARVLPAVQMHLDTAEKLGGKPAPAAS